MDSFDWALVKSFVAVLDAGSLMGAARRLQAQQPTLSRHIAELELQLGAPLFERTGRGVTPTATGLAIAEAARQMEEGASALARSLAKSRDATTGTVRISASQVAATWLLPLAEVEIVAAAHQSYLDRAGTPRRPQDLLVHRLIGYDRDETIMRGFAGMGVSLLRDSFALRTDDQVAYGRLVATGAGIGCVARYNIRHWPGVVALLPQLGIPALPCWLAVHRGIRGNRLVRRVYDFLADAIPAAVVSG